MRNPQYIPLYLALYVVVWPFAQVHRGVDWCRRKWYTRYPRQFDVLTAETRDHLRDLFASTAIAMEYSHEKCVTNDTTCILAENGAFTERTAACILARVYPLTYITEEMYLKQLHDAVVADVESLRGPYWQVGLDEHGNLGIVATKATVDVRAPSTHKRAKVGVFAFGRRANNK